MEFKKEILGGKIGVRTTSRLEFEQLIKWINKYSSDKYRKRKINDNSNYLIGNVIWCCNDFGSVLEYDREEFIIKNHPEVQILDFNNAIETKNTKGEKMQETKFVPKQGSIIEVKFGDISDWRKREFISMTSDNNYLCWRPDKNQALTYSEVRPIKPAPTYYYKYKKLVDNTLRVSDNYIPDDAPIAEKYVEDGWEKIQSTRTTYEELC